MRKLEAGLESGAGSGLGAGRANVSEVVGSCVVCVVALPPGAALSLGVQDASLYTVVPQQSHPAA